MFIQKVFHVRHGLSATKAAFAKTDLYRGHLDGVKKAVVTGDGVGQFDCELPGGFRAHCVLVELPTGDSNQTLFHSTAGNIELSGLVEFIAIRDNLTEIQLTLECSFKSTFCAFLSATTNGFEQFLNRQIDRLQRWFDDASLPLAEEVRSRFVARLPELAG